MSVEKYEVAKITDIDKCHPYISFQDGRGGAGLGCFNNVSDAKKSIKEYKNNHPSESSSLISLTS